MPNFTVSSPYQPAGDQPKAIETLCHSIEAGNQYQTLLGVTGSGKTYTMAKVIEKTKKPTLIMTHNKTLAAQLYSEFKAFFPNNHVEYFISYYDYYQPEAFLPTTGLYIEKDLSINEEIEKLRMVKSDTENVHPGRAIIKVHQHKIPQKLMPLAPNPVFYRIISFLKGSKFLQLNQ